MKELLLGNDQGGGGEAPDSLKSRGINGSGLLQLALCLSREGPLGANVLRCGGLNRVLWCISSCRAALRKHVLWDSLSHSLADGLGLLL